MAGGFRIASRSVVFWGVVRALTMYGRGSYESVLQSVPENENEHKQNRALFSEERDAVFAVSRSFGAQ